MSTVERMVAHAYTVKKYGTNRAQLDFAWSTLSPKSGTMPPPPCRSVRMEFLRWWALLGSCHTYCIRPKSCQSLQHTFWQILNIVKTVTRGLLFTFVPNSLCTHSLACWWTCLCTELWLCQILSILFNKEFNGGLWDMLKLGMFLITKPWFTVFQNFVPHLFE